MHVVLTSLLTALMAGAPPSTARFTLTGEVIDVQCLDRAADNHGTSHADCALSCARRGAVLGLRTSDGVYTITGPFTLDRNKKLIEFVAMTVKATGVVSQKDGRRLINVSAIVLDR
jgi:hypothetical protein